MPYAYTDRKSFIEAIAPAAMEAQRRYGIPASITIAQAVIESTSGTSKLFGRSNNMFGMKAGSKWKGETTLANDDKPNEKFRVYGSVKESIDDHSRLLANAGFYAKARACAQDDYAGWAKGLQAGGYATNPEYARQLINLIEDEGLHEYDRRASSMGPLTQEPGAQETQKPQAAPQDGKRYSMPLGGKELLVTSDFNLNRRLPGEGVRPHKGIDFQARMRTPVLSTEDGGKVVAVDLDPKGAGGKTVHIEYAREDGSKWDVAYCHLDNVEVRVGDVVDAGERVGYSGNTGSHTTGPHLHMQTRFTTASGEPRDPTDPTMYLAEIAQRGELSAQVLSGGKDELAQYKGQDLIAQYGGAPATEGQLASQENRTDMTMDPETWARKLLAGADFECEDKMVEMLMNLVFGIKGIAEAVDEQGETEARQSAMDALTAMATSGKLDLTPASPGADKCVLDFSDPSNLSVTTTRDGKEERRGVSEQELRQLSAIAKDGRLTAEEKGERMGGLLSPGPADEALAEVRTRTGGADLAGLEEKAARHAASAFEELQAGQGKNVNKDLAIARS